MLLKTSSRIDFVISILAPFIGFFLAFIFMITLIELITPHTQIFSDLEPSSPVSILFILFKYVTMDFGINQNTMKPIFEEIQVLFGASFELLLFSFIFSLILISPFVLVDISSQKSSLSHNRALIIRAASFITIFTPFILVLFPKLIQIISIDLYELHQGFITPFYRREGADPLGRLIIPVLWIGGTSFILCVISIALGFRAESVLKVSIIGLTLADIAFETIFAWPGLGRFFYVSFLRTNYTVTLGILFFIGIVLLIILTLITIIFHFVSSKEPVEAVGQPEIPISMTEIQNEIQTKPLELLTTVSIFVFLILLFILPIFSPFDPHETTTLLEDPPGGIHVLGTNRLAQDIFSRILFCLQNFAIIYFLGGLGAVIGIIIYNILPQRHDLFTKLLSTLPYAGFILLYGWGIFVSLNEELDWFIPTIILIIIFFTAPLGFIISNNQTKNQEGIIHSFRLAFSLGGLVCAMIVEYGSFVGLFGTYNDLLFGRELNVAIPHSFDFPWTFEGPLLFLAIICSIILLLTFLVKIISSGNAISRERKTEIYN